MTAAPAIPAPPTSAQRKPLGARVRIQRKTRFGIGGFWYSAITLFTALGAFNSQNNLLYWTFGFALALLLVSGTLSLAMLMGVRVEREWISGAAVGDPIRVRYRVRNTNRLFPAFALSIEEQGFDPPSPAKLSLWQRIRGVRPAPPGSAPLFSRPHAFVAHVGAGETVHTEARVIARKRGPATFTGLIVQTSFPFGLVHRSLQIDQHGAAVVTPQPVPVDLESTAASSRNGHQNAASRRAGRGDEFFALREYVHGDSPRDVAWRASAKRGTLLVRQFAAPTPQRVWIVLHLRARPGTDADDEHAIRIAAGLARRAEAAGMEYALAVPLTRLLVHPRRGDGHLSRLMTDLGLIDLGLDDGRGARSAFPPQTTSGGSNSSCVVVHGGQLDGAFAPRSDRVMHIIAHAGDALDNSPVRPIAPRGGATQAA